MKTVFMFSGQGAHYFQMGRPLYERNPIFREHLRNMDDMARPLTGVSVLETLYSPANRIGATFDRTLLTHPAIFMVEYAAAQALIDAGVFPDLVLGTSLGSFVAAALAGFISLEDALTAVVRHALAVERHCAAGAMIAILADPGLYDEEFLREACDCAAVNSSHHFVVSAVEGRCADIQRRLDVLEIPWQRLAVSYAFHSRWIDAARPHFESFMKSVPIRGGTLPLVCCDRAKSLTALYGGYFWDVTRHPIRFAQAITSLEQRGPYRYVDAGPSGTLATLLKYVLTPESRSEVFATLTPGGQDLRNWASLTSTADKRRPAVES